MATIISIIKAILLKPASDICMLKSTIINACGLDSKIANSYQAQSIITQSIRYMRE